MNKIILILIGLLMINLASAIQIYEGRNIITPYLDYISNYKVINNQTWINISQTSNNTLQVTIPELAENISFSLVIEGYKNEEEKIVYVNAGGSGGGSTKYVYRNNTIYVDKIRYVDKEVIKENNNTITLTNEVPNKLNKPILISAIILIFLLLLVTYLYLQKKRNLEDFINETIK